MNTQDNMFLPSNLIIGQSNLLTIQNRITEHKIIAVL